MMMDFNKRDEIFSKHFVIKVGLLSKQKAILSLLPRWIQIDSMPYKPQDRELIYYEEILTAQESDKSQHELILHFNKRSGPKKSKLVKYRLSTENRQLLLTDFYKMYKSSMLTQRQSSMQLVSSPSAIQIQAKLLVDSEFSNYSIVQISAYATHLEIKYQELFINNQSTIGNATQVSSDSQSPDKFILLNQIGSDIEGNYVIINYMDIDIIRCNAPPPLAQLQVNLQQEMLQQQTQIGNNNIPVTTDEGRNYSLSKISSASLMGNPQFAIIMRASNLVFHFVMTAEDFQSSESNYNFGSSSEMIKKLLTLIQKNSQEHLCMQIYVDELSSVTAPVVKMITVDDKFVFQTKMCAFKVISGQKCLHRLILAIDETHLYEICDQSGNILQRIPLLAISYIIHKDFSVLPNVIKLIMSEDNQSVEYAFEPYCKDIFTTNLLQAIAFLKTEYKQNVYNEDFFLHTIEPAQNLKVHGILKSKLNKDNTISVYGSSINSGGGIGSSVGGLITGNTNILDNIIKFGNSNQGGGLKNAESLIMNSAIQQGEISSGGIGGVGSSGNNGADGATLSSSAGAISSQDPDFEIYLLKNVCVSSNEEKFYASLREFNINAQMRHFLDHDSRAFKLILRTLDKQLQFYFEKHVLEFINNYYRASCIASEDIMTAMLQSKQKLICRWGGNSNLIQIKQQQQQQFSKIILQAMSMSSIATQEDIRNCQQERMKCSKEMQRLMMEQIVIQNDQNNELEINMESIILFMFKIEELLKALTILLNCKVYYEDVLVIQAYEDQSTSERNEALFGRIVELLDSPHHTISYLASIFLCNLCRYHSNLFAVECYNKQKLLNSQRINIFQKIGATLAQHVLYFPQQVNQQLNQQQQQNKKQNEEAQQSVQQYKDQQKNQAKRGFMDDKSVLPVYGLLRLIYVFVYDRHQTTLEKDFKVIINIVNQPYFFAVLNRIARNKSLGLQYYQVMVMRGLLQRKETEFVQKMKQQIFYYSTQLVWYILQSVALNSKYLRDAVIQLLSTFLYHNQEACNIVSKMFPFGLFQKVNTEIVIAHKKFRRLVIGGGGASTNLGKLAISKSKKEHHNALEEDDEEESNDPNNLLNIGSTGKLSEQLMLDEWTMKSWQMFFQNLRKNWDTAKIQWNDATRKEFKRKMREVDRDFQSLFKPFDEKQIHAIILGNRSEGISEEKVLSYYWNSEEFDLEYESLKDKFCIAGRYYLVRLVDDFQACLTHAIGEPQAFWKELIFAIMDVSSSSNSSTITADTKQLAYCIKCLILIFREYSQCITEVIKLRVFINLLNNDRFGWYIKILVLQLFHAVFSIQQHINYQEHINILNKEQGLDLLMCILSVQFFDENSNYIPQGRISQLDEIPQNNVASQTNKKKSLDLQSVSELDQMTENNRKSSQLLPQYQQSQQQQQTLLLNEEQQLIQQQQSHQDILSQEQQQQHIIQMRRQQKKHMSCLIDPNSLPGASKLNKQSPTLMSKMYQQDSIKETVQATQPSNFYNQCLSPSPLITGGLDFNSGTNVSVRMNELVCNYTSLNYKRFRIFNTPKRNKFTILLILNTLKNIFQFCSNKENSTLKQKIVYPFTVTQTRCAQRYLHVLVNMLLISDEDLRVLILGILRQYFVGRSYEKQLLDVPGVSEILSQQLISPATVEDTLHIIKDLYTYAISVNNTLEYCALNDIAMLQEIVSQQNTMPSVAKYIGVQETIKGVVNLTPIPSGESCNNNSSSSSSKAKVQMKNLVALIQKEFPFLLILPGYFFRIMSTDLDKGVAKNIEIYFGKQKTELPQLIWSYHMSQRVHMEVVKYTRSFKKSLLLYSSLQQCPDPSFAGYPRFDKGIKKAIQHKLLQQELRCGPIFLRVWMQTQFKFYGVSTETTAAATNSNIRGESNSCIINSNTGNSGGSGTVVSSSFDKQKFVYSLQKKLREYINENNVFPLNQVQDVQILKNLLIIVSAQKKAIKKFKLVEYNAFSELLALLTQCIKIIKNRGKLGAQSNMQSNNNIENQAKAENKVKQLVGKSKSEFVRGKIQDIEDEEERENQGEDDESQDTKSNQSESLSNKDNEKEEQKEENQTDNIQPNDQKKGNQIYSQNILIATNLNDNDQDIGNSDELDIRRAKSNILEYRHQNTNQDNTIQQDQTNDNEKDIKQEAIQDTQKTQGKIEEDFTQVNDEDKQVDEETVEDDKQDEDESQHSNNSDNMRRDDDFFNYNSFIKQGLKAIYLLFNNSPVNVHTFIQSRGLNHIFYILNNLQLQIMQTSDRELSQYFEDISLNIIDLQNIHECFKILMKTYFYVYIKGLIEMLDASIRVDLCLLYCKISKISLIYYYTFCHNYQDYGLEEGSSTTDQQQTGETSNSFSNVYDEEKTHFKLYQQYYLQQRRWRRPSIRELCERIFTPIDYCEFKSSDIDQLFARTRLFSDDWCNGIIAFSANYIFQEGLIKGGVVYRCIEFILMSPKLSLQQTDDVQEQQPPKTFKGQEQEQYYHNKEQCKLVALKCALSLRNILIYSNELAYIQNDQDDSVFLPQPQRPQKLEGLEKINSKTILVFWKIMCNILGKRAIKILIDPEYSMGICHNYTQISPAVYDALTNFIVLFSQKRELPDFLWTDDMKDELMNILKKQISLIIEKFADDWNSVLLDYQYIENQYEVKVEGIYLRLLSQYNSTSSMHQQIEENQSDNQRFMNRIRQNLRYNYESSDYIQQFVNSILTTLKSEMQDQVQQSQQVNKTNSAIEMWEKSNGINLKTKRIIDCLVSIDKLVGEFNLGHILVEKENLALLTQLLTKQEMKDDQITIMVFQIILTFVSPVDAENKQIYKQFLLSDLFQKYLFLNFEDFKNSQLSKQYATIYNLQNKEIMNKKGLNFICQILLNIIDICPLYLDSVMSSGLITLLYKQVFDDSQEATQRQQSLQVIRKIIRLTDEEKYQQQYNVYQRLYDFLPNRIQKAFKKYQANEKVIIDLIDQTSEKSESVSNCMFYWTILMKLEVLKEFSQEIERIKGTLDHQLILEGALNQQNPQFYSIHSFNIKPIYPEMVNELQLTWEGNETSIFLRVFNKDPLTKIHISLEIFIQHLAQFCEKLFFNYIEKLSSYNQQDWNINKKLLSSFDRLCSSTVVCFTSLLLSLEQYFFNNSHPSQPHNSAGSNLRVKAAGIQQFLQNQFFYWLNAFKDTKDIHQDLVSVYLQMMYLLSDCSVAVQSVDPSQLAQFFSNLLDNFTQSNQQINYCNIIFSFDAKNSQHFTKILDDEVFLLNLILKFAKEQQFFLQPIMDQCLDQLLKLLFDQQKYYLKFYIQIILLTFLSDPKQSEVLKQKIDLQCQYYSSEELMKLAQSLDYSKVNVKEIWRTDFNQQINTSDQALQNISKDNQNFIRLFPIISNNSIQVYSFQPSGININESQIIIHFIFQAKQHLSEIQSFFSIKINSPIIKTKNLMSIKHIISDNSNTKAEEQQQQRKSSKIYQDQLNSPQFNKEEAL